MSAVQEYDARWAFHFEALERSIRTLQASEETLNVVALLAESVRMLQFDLRRIATEGDPHG